MRYYMGTLGGLAAVLLCLSGLRGETPAEASDRSGGISAGFVVEWESEHLCVPPVVEVVLISTASTQSISFSSQARIVEERR
jgi:hypothetical protein